MAIEFITQTNALLASSSTPTITAPGGILDGDVLIAQFMMRGGVLGTAGTSGFTEVAMAVTNPPSIATITGQTFYKAITSAASEPASYAFAVSSAQTSGLSVIVLRGADTSSPIDTFSSQGSSAASTPATAPGVTVARAGSYLLKFISSHAGSSAWNNPAEMPTEFYDSGTGSGTSTRSIHAYGEARNAGATGDRSAASTGGGGFHWLSQMVAVKAAITDTDPPAAPTGLTATVIAPPA